MRVNFSRVSAVCTRSYIGTGIGRLLPDDIVAASARTSTWGAGGRGAAAATCRAPPDRAAGRLPGRPA